jgi:hypothetical protein
MNRQRTPETLVKQALEVEPSAAEREVVWQAIVEQLDERDARAPTPARRLLRRDPRLARLAAVGLAALAAALAAVALLPTGDQHRGSGTPLVATASAAEVLSATATSARSALPVVGPGEYLFTRTSRTISGEGAASVDTATWTATDGSARIVDRERASRLVRGPRGDIVRKRRTETAITSYRPGSEIGLVSENGVTRRPPPPQLSPNWRHVVGGDEVVTLPAEREALLASLRAGAERAARAYRQPRPPGYYPRVDRTYELAGRDLLVVETATALLVQAPLSPTQRAALLSLLADAPGWYRPGTSTEPIQIRNLGPTEDALGRHGLAVEFAIELTSDEARAASPGTFDLVLDAEAGRLLETRSYEHGPDAEPVRLTVVAQRVVDAIDAQP